MAFVGASGNLLFKTLMSNGIQRKSCRVANVFWRRPPGNNISIAKKSPLWSDYCMKTKEDILSSKPKVILALGSEALKLLFPEKNISSSRGYIMEWNGIPVVATWHPAAVIRNMSLDFSFKLDIKKAVDIYLKGFDSRLFKQPLMDMFPNNKEKFIELLEEIREKQLFFSIDIECQQKPAWRCNCIGIATGNTAVNTMPTPDAVEALKETVKAVGDKAIFHNAMFDLTWLYGEFGIEWSSAPYDTMVMHHVLLCDQPKSLEYCVSIYLNVPSWKEMRWAHDETKWIYNLLDCIYTHELFFVLKKELETMGFWDVYYNQKRKELLPAQFMGYLGLRLDVEKLQEHRIKVEEEMQEIAEELYELSGYLNLNSPKQLKELLYNRWHLPTGKLKGKVSVNEDVLKTVMKKIPKSEEQYKEWIKKYLKWKNLSSILSKELKVEPCPFTGVVNTSYNIAGTEGARWSSSAPLWGGGTNFQNRSKPFRDIYIPRFDDWVFLGADYSGAEARIVAWRCGDDICKKAFLEGKDIHKLTASMMFGVREEEVTKELRNIGKRIRHASNYNMSWRKLAELMEISWAEARELLERYHRAYPNVRQVFHLKTQEIIRRTKMLTDAWGLPRIFTGRLDDKAFREAYAFYPQSTCTHTLNKALLELWEWSKPLNWVALQFQIHDEIVLIVKKENDKILEAMERIKKAMLIEIPIVDLSTDKVEPLVLPIEFKIGLNWGDMIEFDSEEEIDSVLEKIL